MSKHIWHIGGSAALNLLPSLTNLLAAWMVVHFASDQVWGSFVSIQLFVGLALHVLSWGNRDFLMRIFSTASPDSAVAWKTVFFSRGALLFIALPVLLLAYPPQFAAIVLLWLLLGAFRQSFDVVVTFRRDFTFGAMVELMAGIFTLGAIFLMRAQLGHDLLAIIFAASQGLRLVPFLFKYGREFLVGPAPSIHFLYFQRALPFFLLGFASLLVGRMDLYCLAAMQSPQGIVTEATVGDYQIWTGLIVYLQSVAAFLVQPLIKYLYRLPLKSVWKLTGKMLLWGSCMIAAGLPVIWLLLTYWYRIEVNAAMYWLVIPYVLPVYAMAAPIFYLYRMQAQQFVLISNGAAMLINLAVGLVLIPRYGMVGAMVAAGSGQLMLAFLTLSKVARMPSSASLA